MIKTLCGLILVSSFLISPRSWALSLKISSTLTQSEHSRAEAAINTVIEKLPLKMKRLLNIEIKIVFKEMNDSATTRHLGYAKYLVNEIEINKSLLNDTINEQFKIKHDSLERTIAHEIAHFYDFKNFRTPPLQHFINTCDEKEEACQARRFQRRTLSFDPEFMAITHWVRGLVAKNINNFQLRLPDLNAVKSINESFPTLFEFYLFDDDFACNLPVVSRFFDKAFEIKPRFTSCSENLVWYSIDASGPKFIEIAKSRIWAVDYFWAAEGEGFASANGHAMFRLVVCSPERQKPSNECYKDVSHHLILSFGANTPDLNFKNIGGLVGRYPINLTVTSVFVARAIYNLTELRDLYSIPLKLNSTQKSNLIDYLYDYLWNFRGDYYFTNQNCASETSRALIASGIDFELAAQVQSHMPDTLFTKLLNSDLNNSGVKKREDLQQNPLLFMVSSRATINLALNVISSHTKIDLKNLESYFKKISPEQVIEFGIEPSINSKFIFALYYLEQIRFNRIKQEVYKSSFQKNEDLKEVVAKKLSQLTKRAFDYSFPGTFLNSKYYGRPSVQEIASIKKSISEEVQIYQDKIDSENSSTQENQNRIQYAENEAIKSSMQALNFLKNLLKREENNTKKM